MKTRTFRHPLPHSFAQRLHSQRREHMLESMSPDPGAERGKRVFENILRWEDDGGRVLASDHPILRQAAETSTPRLQDASGDCLL